MSALPFAPNWISCPGSSISDRMKELNISDADMAEKLNITLEDINRLIAGLEKITIEKANRISAG